MNTLNATVNSSISVKPDVLPAMPTQDVLDLFITINVCQLVGSCVLFSLVISSLIIQNQLRSGAGFLVFHQLLTEGQMGCIHYFVYILTYYKYNLSTHTPYYNNENCRHLYMAYMVTTTAGMMGIFSLAVNRYIALIHPLQYKKFSTKKVTALAVVVCWAYGILTHIYFYIGRDGGFVATKPFGSCGFAKQGTAFKVFTILGTFVPLMAAAFVYILLFGRMFWTRRIGNNQLIANPDSPAARRLARRFALTKILFVSSLLYCACFASIPIVQGFFPEVFFGNPMTRLWFRTVFFTGYVLTPIVFFMMNLEYRMGVVKVFQWLCIGNNQNQTAPLGRPSFKTTKTNDSGSVDQQFQQVAMKERNCANVR